MPRATRTDSPQTLLLRALTALIGGLRLGEWANELRTDDFIIDWSVRVRHRTEWRAADVFVNRALAFLASRNYWVEKCGVEGTRKKGFSGYYGSCSRGISTVIVKARRPYSWDYAYPPYHGCASLDFSFCCAQHAERFKTNDNVLAVLPLPSSTLRSIREQVQRIEAIARERRWRLEQLGEFMHGVAEVLTDGHPPGCICPKHQPRAAVH